MKLEEEIQQRKFKSEHQKASLNVMYTGGWLNAQTNQLLKPFGLSHQQFNVLRILRGVFPASANLCHIQCKMLDKMSNATRLVEKLREKGLVTRDLCQENRRKVEIAITQKGLELLEKIDAPLEAYHREMCSRLNEEEAREVNRLMDKMRE